MNDLVDEAQLILDRVKGTPEDAEAILQMDMTLAGVSRTYYGLFYCMSALLSTEDLVSKTHSDPVQSVVH
jgi:uncharacterized protein (UPF0332 family)